ncbi:MAG: 16S rRNA (guanine(966)-N(2))-methyltransferase RsmD [Burkholderiales bacterium]|nr:16S rRNA (guanine(966)-N(2))-methyltransferase RsmD [Burkholderiales bacterium]
MPRQNCELRIIGGAWRSRKIRFADRPGLRPTPDRVRETLFNWLGQDLSGRECLDLFAGSGALGFEAASRGARRVLMVERDAAALRALQSSREMLHADAVEVLRADALEFLPHHPLSYDVVFLDPPFAEDCWTQLLELLPRCLKPGALVYCERAETLDAGPGWNVIKAGRAGQVSYQLLKRAEHEQ